MSKMTKVEAISLLNFHKTFLAANDADYREEYLDDLVDDSHPASGVNLAEAIEIVLEIISKGSVMDGQGKDFKVAS